VSHETKTKSMCVRAYHDIDNPEEIYFYKCDVD
jgi:hypothetical protein